MDGHDLPESCSDHPLLLLSRDAVDKYLERRALKGIESYPWAQKMAMRTKGLIADLIHTKPERIGICPQYR